MNKDQYWQKIIRERPEFQAGPTSSMTLTVLDIRQLVKDAYAAGEAAATKRRPDAGKSIFDTIFGQGGVSKWIIFDPDHGWLLWSGFSFARVAAANRLH